MNAENAKQRNLNHICESNKRDKTKRKDKKNERMTLKCEEKEINFFVHFI